MFFNYPTMFETPMFYQPRPTYYQRRPRTVYRRPQPERTFNFSPFMSELDDIYRYPVRQQTNNNDCDCANCRNNIQEQAKKLEPESETEILEPEELPKSLEQQKASENEEDSKSENSESENCSELQNVKKIEDSKNYNAIIEIAKQSEAIQKDLENTDWDCLDEKQEMKKLRYAAENQYKLIEKLDSIHSENNEERNLRKSTVKSIQKRLDSLDSKLN